MNGTKSAKQTTNFAFRQKMAQCGWAACVARDITFANRISPENQIIIIRFISVDWHELYGRRPSTSARSEMSDAQLNLYNLSVCPPDIVGSPFVSQSNPLSAQLRSRRAPVEQGRRGVFYHITKHITHTLAPGPSELDSFDGFTCLQCVRAPVYMPIHLSGNIWRRRKQMAFASHHN